MTKRERAAKLAEAKARADAAKTGPVENPSATVEEANAKLGDFAHAQRQRDEAKKTKKSASVAALPDLPRLPKGARKPKAGKPCECGCAAMTKGGRFIPGHDARLHAWAMRVERGLIKASEVPAPHTEAVAKLLKAGRTATKAKNRAVAE